MTRYNPIETLVIRTHVNEKDLLEAYRDINFEDLKYK